MGLPVQQIKNDSGVTETPRQKPVHHSDQDRIS